jgi:hypothetical protein
MELKEVVKEKYGEAARRVVNGGSNGCCGGSALLDGSCDPITSNLYDQSETGQIPKKLCGPHSAAAILPLSQNSILARPCSTWVLDAVSMCCYRRVALDLPAKPTA